MAQLEATMATWQAQQLAKKLENDIRQLNVAMAELDTVKPKKATYVKRANVFFLDRRDMIVKAKRSTFSIQICNEFADDTSVLISARYRAHVVDELKEKEQKRHDIGLQLRSATA